MSSRTVEQLMSSDNGPRAAELVSERLTRFSARCDRMFAVLVLIQWFGAIAAAMWLSPKTWTGTHSSLHPHLSTALFLGGILACLPIVMALFMPGTAASRHAIAVSQMLWSALLIHVTGGRIESHFHIFGSLAFLAFYRDWRVLLTATVVTAADHVLRGWISPQSIYGVLAVSEWRTIEHFFWVLFEDVFLMIVMRRGLAELSENGLLQAELEQEVHRVEKKVQEQTAQLLTAVVCAEAELLARKKAEERARADEAFLIHVGEVAGVGGWQVDLPTNIVSWTHQTCLIHDVAPGYRPSLEEAISFYAPEARPVIAAAVQNGIDHGTSWDVELPIVTAKGRKIFVRAVGEAKYENGVATRLVGAVQDVTLRKMMEDELRSAARTDKLTSLPNRVLLTDRLQQAVLRARRVKDYHFAVLFLDFDRFKIVNDSLGHGAGDLLLVEIARRLRETIRSNDSCSCAGHENTAARIGGDEFVILLDGLASPSDVLIVADRLLEALARPYRLGDQEIYSTASIGIVTSDMTAASAEEVLRDADTAMYEAKLAGKGQYVLFNVSMRQRVQNRLNLENDLRKALESNQLFLVYQPIVSLRTGQIESFEALIRWQHPVRGLVSPAEFIPSAEDSGLILPIGEWVLRKACEQFAIWRKDMAAAAPHSISVNLSRKQLLLPNLTDTIRKILIDTGTPPECLHLEVTESAVMHNADLAVKMLHDIKAMGVKLDMDDFGTGYSSLACLHQFPLDVLKIDRSFVANIDRGRDFAALVHAVTQLARNLNISVVAEGIETADQAAILQSLDCEFGQGYLFSRPLTADQVAIFQVPRNLFPGTSDTESAPDAVKHVA